jgi:hypothetical protein
MKLGFVVDHTYGGFPTPESIWTGEKMSSKERHPVQTFRCARCGYLESYAPPR